ncbi:hypothetical protein HDV01_000499 [Terramyces sp. JEL0728]|nr:hypothetical protein HDV01_000499 [Terramyces sp. JEL0728]
MLTEKPLHFDADEWKHVELGVHKCLHFLRLKFTNNSYTPSENFTKEILVNPEYQEFYSGLRYFLALIGDWNSFLILLDNAPKKCPSISPENIAMYVKWKTHERDTIFTDTRGNAVCDRFGNLVTPQQGWLNYNKVPALLKAVEELHKVYFLTGPYCDMCKRCFKIYQSLQNHGCDSHFKEPKPIRRGNPVESSAVSSSLQYFQDVPRTRKGGSDTLNPFDLLKLRKVLLESGSLIHYQVWVIVLLAVRLFLRVEELVYNTLTASPSGLMIESIDPLLTVYKDGKIKGECELIVALGIIVDYHGKKSTLVLWADHECPMLCPVLHLQAYLYCTKIKSGFLFPSLAELNQPPSDGKFVTILKVGDLVDTIVNAVHEFSPDFEFGLETFVKSGYANATWGGAQLEKIMKSARHTDMETAMRFQGDAELQLMLVKNQGKSVEGVVARWTPILVEERIAARALIDVRYGKTLFESSVEYVENICGVHQKSIYFDMKYCIDKCVSVARKPTALQVVLDKTLLSEEEKGSLTKEIEKYVQLKVATLVNERSVILEKELELRNEIISGSLMNGNRTKRQRIVKIGVNNSPVPEEYNFNLNEAVDREAENAKMNGQRHGYVNGYNLLNKEPSSAPKSSLILPSMKTVSNHSPLQRTLNSSRVDIRSPPPGTHSPQISHLSSPRSIPSTTPRMQSAHIEDRYLSRPPAANPRKRPQSLPVDHPLPLPQTKTPKIHHSDLLPSQPSRADNQSLSGNNDFGSPRSVPSTTPRMQRLPGINEIHSPRTELPNHPQIVSPRLYNIGSPSTSSKSPVWHDSNSPRSNPSTTPRFEPLVMSMTPTLQRQSFTPRLSPLDPSRDSSTPKMLPTPLASPYLSQANLPPISSIQYAQQPHRRDRPSPVNTRVYSPSLSTAGSERYLVETMSPALGSVGTPVTPALSYYSENDLNEGGLSDDENQMEGDAQKKKRKFGEIDLEGRSAISDKQLSDTEKLVRIIGLSAKMPKEMRELTCGARNFVNRTLNPVINCLRNHFGSNQDDFIMTWRSTNKRNKEVVFSRFNEKCKGSGPDCPSRMPTKAENEVVEELAQK